MTEQADKGDIADRADAEFRWRVERSSGDEYRRHADQRVEGGNQLRHRRHRDAARDDGADHAADGSASDEDAPGDGVKLREEKDKRRGDGDGHADDAVAITFARGRGA